MLDSKPGLDSIKELVRVATGRADQAKSEGWTAAETARLYVEIYAFDKLLHELAAESNKLKSRMAYQDVPAAFEREGLKTFTLTEGYRVTLTSFVSASCKDMPTAIAWMKAHEPALVKETINAQTLGAFAKAEMEEGRELPDEIFTVNVGVNTSVTVVKK